MVQRSLASLLLTIILIAGCAIGTNKQNPEQLGKEIVELLVTGEHEQLHEQLFSEKLKETLPLLDFLTLIETKWKSSGDFIELSSTMIKKRGEDHVIFEAELTFSETIYQMRLIFNKDYYVDSFYINNGVSNVLLPDGMIEEEVTIGEGGPYELGGTLTMPKQATTPVPAVVLVQGSGPSDRDASVHAYKPFRDLAWGLAEQGIAVLRYDKRTFVHGRKMGSLDVTVTEETIEDVILASRLLKIDERIDPTNIYLLGHSLGGMLAPRIDREGGDFAGLIIMAGSPRPLWEIIYDQNIALPR